MDTPESGPLPRGWHRITWSYAGSPCYVLTDDIGSAALLRSALNRDYIVTDAKLTSWSEFPPSEFPPDM